MDCLDCESDFVSFPCDSRLFCFLFADEFLNFGFDQHFSGVWNGFSLLQCGQGGNGFLPFFVSRSRLRMSFSQVDMSCPFSLQ